MSNSLRKSLKRKRAQRAQNGLNELGIFQSFEIGLNMLKMDQNLLGKGFENHLTKSQGLLRKWFKLGKAVMNFYQEHEQAYIP